MLPTIYLTDPESIRMSTNYLEGKDLAYKKREGDDCNTVLPDPCYHQ
jgi:hypothetical protein